METGWGDFAGIADPLKFCIIPALSPREAMKFGRCSKTLYRCVQIRFQSDLKELIEKITPLIQKTNAQGASMIAAEFKWRIFQIISRYDQKLPPNLTFLRTTLSESVNSPSVAQTIVSILKIFEVTKFLRHLEPDWRGYLNSWKNGKKGILALRKALDLSKTVPSFVMKKLSKKSSLEVSELQLKQCPIIHEGIRHLKNLQKLIVTHGSFNEIGALLEMPQLRELCLESSSLFSLYPLKKLTSLESLTLSECDLRDSGEQLSQSIRSLTLIGCWGKGPLKDVEIKNSGQLENVCLDRLSIAESSEGLFTISLSSLPNVKKMGGGGAKRGSLESLSLLIEGLNSLEEVDFGNISCIGEIAIRRSPNLKSCRLPTHCQLAALVDLPSLVSAHLENKEHSFGSLYLFDLPKLHLPFLSVSVSNIYVGGDLQNTALQILAKNADGYGEVMAASPMLEALSVKSCKKKTMALDLFSNSQLKRLALTDCIGGLESPVRFLSGQLEAFAKIQALNIS
ncbi:MAG: hypothetical protein KDK40_05380, partial [Chlamydiia bacterium]|nr:hypothetical protein [Chlamydiia bacterium]